jgi:uncharacterized membrane protein
MLRALAIALTIVLCHGAASAQSGGSMGSSDFSGGGSSGGSSSSSSGSSGGSSGSSEPSRPPSAATFGVPDAELGAAFFVAPDVPSNERDVTARGADRAFSVWCGATPMMFFALLGLAWAFGTTAAQRRARMIARSQGPCEVRRVSIGFDWSVRRDLQAALDRMASTMSLEGSEGRREGARAAAAHLAAALGGARFASFQSYRVTLGECEARFQTLATDLRSRFKHETAGVRAHGSALDFQARATEGEGLVVVSVIVATDRWMEPLPTTMDRDAIAAAVAQLGRIQAPNVYALEIVWSPSLENDRMSSLELEASYPELQALDGVPKLGRVVCDYCRAPFPAELGRCPGCGAPR